MQLTIPLGNKISQTEDNSIQIHIPNTKFLIHGIQQPSKKWDAYLIDPNTHHKEILKKNTTTKNFALFSTLILKTPFPFNPKQTIDISIIKKLMKKLIKKTLTK
jgi:hypothetical protein